MIQNLYQKIKSVKLFDTEPDTDLMVHLAGMIFGLPLLMGGVIEAIGAYGNKLFQAAEYITVHPYEAAVGAAGVAALGFGAYKYVERKLHVAETLDNFVERARSMEVRDLSIDVKYNYGGSMMTGTSYDLSVAARNLMDQRERLRYKLSQEEIRGYCQKYLVDPELTKEVEVDTVFCAGHTQGLMQADSIFSGIGASITLAEDLQHKLSSTVTWNGGTVEKAKDYLVLCKKWVKSGQAYIIG